MRLPETTTGMSWFDFAFKLLNRDNFARALAVVCVIAGAGIGVAFMDITPAMPVTGAIAGILVAVLLLKSKHVRPAIVLLMAGLFPGPTKSPMGSLGVSTPPPGRT